MRKVAALIHVLSIPTQQQQAERCSTKCTESLAMLLSFTQEKKNNIGCDETEFGDG